VLPTRHFELRNLPSAVLPPLVALAVVGVVGWLTVVAGTAVDIDTYRASAYAVLDGRSPYEATPVPYLYPPGAVFVILPAAIGSTLQVANVVWVAISLVALARTMWILVREAWPELEPHRTRNRFFWVFAVACLLEPTLLTLAFGQMGLLLLWMTVEGLRGQPQHAARSWLVGLASAIKLTPGLVILALAAAGRWRSVVWAGAGLVGTTVAAAAVSPPGLRDYVGGAWRLAYDINARIDPQNHSLIGVAKLAGLPGWAGWAAAFAALLIGITVTSWHWRRGDELAGLATVLVTSLVALPVSWGHYWVAAYPALILLQRDVRIRRPWSALLLASALVGMLLWVDTLGNSGALFLPPGETWSPLAILQREWWLLWGIAFLAWSAARLLSRRPGHLEGVGDAGA